MTQRNFFVNHGLECGDIVISAVNNTITGLATAAPSADGDVSNKKYVDDQDALIASDTLTFTNKTFDANGTGNSISNIETADFASAAFKDEDNMASDSATSVASQQSIKAYVDTEIGNISSTTLTAGNTTAVVSDSGSDGAFTVTCEGNTELVVNDTSSTFSGNVIVSGNFTVNGTTTTLNSDNKTITDALIELANGTTGSPSNDSGIIIERGDSNNAFIGFDESEDKFKVGTGTFTGASTGNLTITTGTLVANLEGNVTGDVTGTADVATAVTVADESSDTSCNVLFTTAASGNLGPKSGTNLTFNSSSGVLTATGFAGDLTGDVTGTATEATNVTVSANNTANETVYLTFVDGATGTQGIETDTGLSYNPNTNVLTTTAAQAQYADLAEKYTTSTGDLEPGTVVRVLIGPGHNDALPEVEPAMQDSIPVGVISTAPAYLMNADSEGQAVALKGRVPVKVTGEVTKGQAVYVDDNGHATASNTGSMMVGVALESNSDSAVKLVECVLKV